MTVEAPAGSGDVAHTATSATARAGPVEGAAISLALAARDGNRAAWDELVRRFTPLLWVIAGGHRLSRDDAADVVRMTWLRCVERLDQVRDQDGVAAWLVTICHRESMIALRQAARGGWRDVGDDPGDPADTGAGLPASGAGVMADAVIEVEDEAVLHQAIAELPDRPRQILTALLDRYDPDARRRAVTG